MNGQSGEYGGPPPPAEPPAMPPPGGGGGASAASSKVAGPAIGLMITAGVGIALHILGLLVKMSGFDPFGMRAYENQDMALAHYFRGAVGITFTFLFIGVWIVVLLGAARMKKLENYSLAMTAAILSMIPCNCPCCLAGIPIGIWALVVLMDPNVKRAFRS